MPTILKQNGFEVLIYIGNEHIPPHVHVFKAGAHLRVAIGDAATYPYPFGKGNSLKGVQARQAIRLVAEYQAELAAKWEEIHGTSL